MPLAACMPVLAAELQPLFTQPPTSSAEAGTRFAQAYASYCLAGGATVLPPKQQLLGLKLAVSFDANGGGGAAGVIQALTAFWPGTPVPAMAPSAQAVAFTPAGDLSFVIPGAAELSSAAQAQGLAALVHALTMASVKVVIPPSPALLPIA